METGAPGKSCMRCNRTFKRLEHLKRHERVHDNHGRFPCSACDKVFTRSDVLRRHESTHAAALQSNGGADTGSKRACTECAKARERCTKSHPCQRCFAKNLLCFYPQARGDSRNHHQLLSPDPAHQRPFAVPTRAPTLEVAAGGEPTLTTSDRSSSLLVGVEKGIAPRQFMMQPLLDEHPAPFEMTSFVGADHSSHQNFQPEMDFSLNWLPNDDSITIDYDNILGLDISSLGLFPSLATSIPTLTSATTHGASMLNNSVGENIEAGVPAQQRPESHAAHRNGTPWNATSPGAGSGQVAFAHSSLVSHNIPSKPEPGGLYATSSNGARMPCTTRGRRSSRLIPSATPLTPIADMIDRSQRDPSRLEFPNISQVSIDYDLTPVGSNVSSVPMLGMQTYETLQQQFSKLCLNEQSVFPTYTSTSFPSLAFLNFFVQLYYDNFDPIIPIVHDRVVPLSDHWLLVLAVCAIGCHYAEADEFSGCVEPLHQMLRRAIVTEFEGWKFKSTSENEHGIALAQALTLNQIGMLYFGSPTLLKLAKAQHGVLVDVVRSSGFLHAPSNTNNANLTSFERSHDLVWKRMLMNECKRRIGYTVWLLDCMSVYHFSQRPLMPPDFGECALPNDKLWLMTSPEDSAMQPESSNSIPSLSVALAHLFREKQAGPNLGQFSRVILLHGIYREIFQLKECFARPLGKWVPSMQQALDDNGTRKDPSLSDASGQSLLSSWRNAALDCVDVLHWVANATIALQAGAEHPTVLHLHLARTVLLAPFDQIQTLAASIASISPSFPTKETDAPSGQKAVGAEHDVLDWAQRDQYKARLAVLHCGCLFWHIRRYSCRAFYEPHAVFLATLTIWAYSSYASRLGSTRQRDENMSTSPHDGNAGLSPLSGIDVTPNFIHLDRPNDDEMVQLFVLSGAPSIMKAHISGVGDIYSTRGPIRILREGRKLLGAVSTAWGRTKKYISILEALEQISSGRTHQLLDTPSDSNTHRT